MATDNGGGKISLLDELGQVWQASRSGNPVVAACWQRLDVYDPPVAISQIKHWQPLFLVTNDDHVWVFLEIDQGWHDCGPWPGGPVPTSETTWGAMKDKFRKGE